MRAPLAVDTVRAKGAFDPLLDGTVILSLLIDSLPPKGARGRLLASIQYCRGI